MTVAAEYRKRKAERAAAIAPVDVTLPSGAVFKLRKVSMTPYALGASMPRTLFTEASTAWKEQGLIEGPGPLESKLQQANEEDNKRGLILMGRVVQDACVSPRIVIGGTGEDELDPSELEEPDIWAIFKWATGQVPGAVVETANGGVEQDVLAKFRKEPGRRVRAGGNGAKLPQAPKRPHVWQDS